MIVDKIKFKALDDIELDGFIQGDSKTDILISIHGMSSNCFNNRENIIANEVNKIGIDYFSFNNRGSEIIKYTKKVIDGQKQRLLGGCANEDVLESYEDIVSAILKAKQLGYKNIHLQGHSLGCTKILYTYTRLKKENSELLSNIKSIILLSLVDIPALSKFSLGKKFEEYIKLAEDKIANGLEYDLMPKDAFLHPTSAKSFIRYIKNNQEIDFINSQHDKDLSILNSIKIPLFMRWGNKNELILEEADIYSNKIKDIIKNENKDISYIDGANHSYSNKEEVLAKQICGFLEKTKK